MVAIFGAGLARCYLQGRILDEEGTNILNAFIGGICIGLGAMLLMLANGRIAGVSGLLYRSFSDPRRHFWALLFLAGLCLGTVIHLWLSGQPAPVFDQPLSTLLPAAFLVGVGTRIGNGCTSGHGICGIGRLSQRSIVATVLFVGTAFVTVFLHSGFGQ